MSEASDNPVVVSVVLMCILCLSGLNVLVVLIISTLAAGPTAGMTVNDTMSVFTGGMAGNAETAISYVLLGAIAAGIVRIGLMSTLSDWMQKVFEEKKILFLLVIAGTSSSSGTIIPVNITFMSILIPPSTYMMNRMRTDRHVTACVPCWGNRALYLFIPVGYGLIFHSSMSTNMTKYDVPMNTMDVWKVMTLPVGVGMMPGLLFVMFVLYEKPRDYKDIEIAGVTYPEEKEGKITLNRRHIGAIIAAFSTSVTQSIFGSPVIGGVVGLLIMALGDCFKYSELDDVINSGIDMIDWISFIMLAASGFSEAIAAPQGVDKPVSVSAGAPSASKIMSSVVLILIRFTIVTGTGTCFGTVPILVAIHVPMCLTLGYSALGTACLIGVATSVGDVCFPTSGGTLGSTSGLNPDGQYDHIWDSAISAILVFSLPLLVIGVITSVVL